MQRHVISCVPETREGDGVIDDKLATKSAGGISGTINDITTLERGTVSLTAGGKTNNPTLAQQQRQLLGGVVAPPASIHTVDVRKRGRDVSDLYYRTIKGVYLASVSKNESPSQPYNKCDRWIEFSLSVENRGETN